MTRSLNPRPRRPKRTDVHSIAGCYGDGVSRGATRARASDVSIVAKQGAGSCDVQVFRVNNGRFGAGKVRREGLESS